MEAWLVKEFRDLRERFESEVVTQVNEPLVLQLDRCYSRGKTVIIQYSCNENDYDYNGNKLSLLSFYFKYYYIIQYMYVLPVFQNTPMCHLEQKHSFATHEFRDARMLYRFLEFPFVAFLLRLLSLFLSLSLSLSLSLMTAFHAFHGQK